MGPQAGVPTAYGQTRQAPSSREQWHTPSPRYASSAASWDAKRAADVPWEYCEEGSRECEIRVGREPSVIMELRLPGRPQGRSRAEELAAAEPTSPRWDRAGPSTPRQTTVLGLPKGRRPRPDQEAAASAEAREGLKVDVPRFVEVMIEVPKGSFVKRRADGSVDYVGFLPCPFNYGSVPAFDALDGDPQDALVLGPPIPRAGKGAAPVRVRVEALLKFTDAGMVDHKLVCLPETPGLDALLQPPLVQGSRQQPFLLQAAQDLAHWLGQRWVGGPFTSDGLASSPLDGRGAPSIRRCPRECLGRCDTGIALPVARRRRLLKCAVCGGAMPFPTCKALPPPPHLASHLAHDTKSWTQLETRRAARNASSTNGSASPGQLVPLNLSLPQFIMLTGFFRFYAFCKGLLNRKRGLKGGTAFEGWEVAHNLALLSS